MQTVQLGSDFDDSAGSRADDVRRPVMTFGAMSVEGRAWRQPRHRHRKAQLLYTLRGVVNCEAGDAVWIVPQRSAVWIPGGHPHAASGVMGAVCCCALVDVEPSAAMPAHCCTLAVSPLLHELLMKAAGFPEFYDLRGPEGRLAATLLDELAAAPATDLHLPMPQDRRLRQLAERLLDRPDERVHQPELAEQIGMSERTLSRRMVRELGMSFSVWRRRLHVILGVQKLAMGASVHSTAVELGYESASSFTTMFRKNTGKSPRRYLVEKLRSDTPGRDASAWIDATARLADSIKRMACSTNDADSPQK
ncbi:helix-turn-helix transcriptional regulator [Burkholderia cenocepacia]|uniref:AraC family transcriptional regulator n=1 Tax=Burkholderia cenocepacia TaxID=95486 RepID=UPI0023BA13D3|nr:helix-turn-helix transcriptional regulator [Burkholderia cenocepacia]MDF0506703.1 helix-turn-helix transcriptional regulator [Burkholderia cenocepacia]